LPSRSIGTDSTVWNPSLNEARLREFGIGGNIGDVRHLARRDRARRQAAPVVRDRIYAPGRIELVGSPAAMSDKVDQRAVVPVYTGAGRAGQCRRRLGDRVEGRLDIGRRAGNDPQYLGCRGLALQCLACLGDQPRVLHRDDRLRGKVLQQCDLFVGERPHLFAANDDYAKENIFLAERDVEQTSITTDIYELSKMRGRAIFVGVQKIGALNDVLAPHDNAAQKASAVRRRSDGTALPQMFNEALFAMHCGRAESIAIKRQKMAESRIAQSQRLVEHRVEVAGRAVDDPQHLRGSSLLLQCLARFG
jgi:hypothetical protein